MNMDKFEQDVIQLLRQTSLGGSDREIDTDDFLGELGIGLDSLALIEFVTALEKRFKVIIPDTIWTDRGQLTLQHFIDAIAESILPNSAVKEDYLPVTGRAARSVELESRQDVQAIPSSNRSQWKKWPLVSQALNFLNACYSREKYFIIVYDLREEHLPSYVSSLNLALQQASEEDAEAMCTFWESFHYLTIDGKKMNMELFRKRIQTGYICLTAWLDDKIVGMDWLVRKGYDCPYTGLRFEWPQDTCYAGELYEHREYRGKGVGLALLAHSLVEAKRAGFHRQGAWVAAQNMQMLSAAIQLFGFKKIGEIRVLRICQHPFSIWEIGDCTGHGGTLII